MVFVTLVSVFNSRWSVSTNSVYNLNYFLVGSNKSSYQSMNVENWWIKSAFLSISDILLNYE